jgi:hypothetical protein
MTSAVSISARWPDAPPATPGEREADVLFEAAWPIDHELKGMHFGLWSPTYMASTRDT